MTPLLDLYLSLDNAIPLDRYRAVLGDFVSLWGNAAHFLSDDLMSFTELSSFLEMVESQDIPSVSVINGAISKKFCYIDDDRLRALSRSRMNALCILVDQDLIKNERYEHYVRYIQDVGLKLEVWYSVNLETQKEIEAILSFCERMGIRLCVVDIDKRNPHRLSGQAYGSFVSDALRRNALRKTPRISIAECPYVNVLGNLKLKAMGGCAGGVTSCMISKIGEVTPCFYLPNIVAGNIKNERLFDIWNKSEIFQSLRCRDNFTGKCKTCANLQVCGGCRAESLYTNGTLYGEDPNCWLV